MAPSFKKNKKRAVFLDRDGVIVREPPHYVYKIEDLHILPRVAEAISLLRKENFKIVVVSNQAGIARGYFDKKDAEIFNHIMEERLRDAGAFIDAIYYCPHHPEAEVLRYRTHCECRKPNSGMLIRASREHAINLSQSFLVGDKWSDIDAGRNAGCGTILVQTGLGQEELKKRKNGADFLAKDLYEAANIIIKT